MWNEAGSDFKGEAIVFVTMLISDESECISIEE